MSGTRLGRVQLRIMQVLWSRRRASAREITDALAADEPGKPIAHSTVQTLLRKLEAKGAVAHATDERTFVFRPLVDQRSFTRTTTRDLIERVFGGSAAGLVAYLLREERIDAHEIAELRKLIDDASPDADPDTAPGAKLEAKAGGKPGTHPAAHPDTSIDSKPGGRHGAQ